MNKNKPNLICEVCKKNNALGVCCVPMVAMSCAYCKECLEANAHPYSVIVANTACIGSYSNANEAWQRMVDATLKHLDKTMAEFTSAVEASVAQMEHDLINE